MRTRGGVSGLLNSFSCCTICAAQDNQRTGLVGLTLFPVWDTLLPILGVNFNMDLESISSLPLCSLCHASLGRIVELRQELDRLALELTTRVGAVRRLVQESVGGQFVHSATQLRGQILVAGGNGAACFTQNSGQGQSASSAQSIVPSTYQEQTSGGGGGGRDKIHPLFFFDPEPQEAVPFNNQGQYLVLASTTQQPVVASQEKNTNLTRSTNNMEETNESSNSNDADVDYFPPSQEEDHQSFRPPRLKKGKYGRPGRLTEEQKANMLKKRKLTEVEQFSPVVKTNDGRQFYEGHEIRSSTTSSDNLQCGTCGWAETNDGSYPWLRIRSMKIHIKAKHLDSYKCKLCSRNLSSLKLLRKHEMMGNCTKKVPRNPSHQCDGCNAKFTFANNLRKHKKVLKCGDLSVTTASLTISTSAIKCAPTPCPIYGRSSDEKADVDYFPPSQEEDHQSFSPPRLKRGKYGRPGRLTEEQKANLLEKRKLTEVEQFSPIVKTNDGRQFYEGHEIRSSTTSSDNLQCGTCGWTETNDGSYPYLRIRSMKIHIKAEHLDSYKCKLCNRNLSCLKQLRKHEMTGNCAKKVPRKHSHQCDGCNAKFTFAHNLRKHKKILKCGDLSVTTAALTIWTSAIKGTPTPCPICGRPIKYTSRNSHLWTHKNSDEKAEAIAAGTLSQCPQCGKVVSRQGFSSHMNTHERKSQRRVKCKVCQRYLLDRFIHRHVRAVHGRSGGKLHIYPEPGSESENQTLTTKTDFAVLKQGHLCNICNVYWTYSSDLTAHLAVHAKQKHTAEMFSFVCSVAGCGVRFTTRLNLECHLKRIHKKTRPRTQNAEEEKNMTIEQPDKLDCVIEITSKGKYRRQENLPPFDKGDGNGNLLFMSFEVLQTGEGYTCVTCGAEFKYENNEDVREIVIKRRAEMNVKRHIIIVHRDDYKCLICGHVAISTLRLQQHERRHVIREQQRCDICGDPFCNSVTENHCWSHLGVTEMVAAINRGEMIPPYFLNKARRLSLAYWEEHDISINCDHCDHPKFPNAVSLYYHISDQHPNLVQYFPKENARNQDKNDHSGLQPTLQLPRILYELRNGTKVLLISGEVVATFSTDGKQILLSDNAEVTIKDELEDEACGVVIPDDVTRLV